MSVLLVLLGETECKGDDAKAERPGALCATRAVRRLKRRVRRFSVAVNPVARGVRP